MSKDFFFEEGICPKICAQREENKSFEELT
jgi:hypothetical protein